VRDEGIETQGTPERSKRQFEEFLGRLVQVPKREVDALVKAERKRRRRSTQAYDEPAK
jgi:hypothetical protein